MATMTDYNTNEPIIHKLQPDTRLARIRKMAGLSQDELAKKAGVSVETICSYEQRKRDISKAQYRIVRQIAKALGCIADDIVEDE